MPTWSKRINAPFPPSHVALALLVLLLTLGATPVAQELPNHVGRVNDFAHLLQPGESATLETQLEDLEKATSAEVAVVTIDSLQGRPVEEYATALFNRWGIGKSGRDNGVLVLIAKDEQTMRIEVGYGLEGVLPDGLAGAIIRESFRPHFRAGDYSSGIREGTARIMEIVRRNETLTPAQRAALDEAARNTGRSWGMAAFLAVFVAISAFVSGTGAGARVIAQTLGGAVFTVLPVVLSSGVAPRAAVVLLAVIGVAVFALGVVLGRRPSWQGGIRGKGGSGWISSGPGRTSSGSGSSSSGRFGGGRSGGGGASASW